MPLSNYSYLGLKKYIYLARTVPSHGALSPQSTCRHSSYKNIRFWPFETVARSDTSGGARFWVCSKLNLQKRVQLRSCEVSKQLCLYYILCFFSFSHLYLSDKWNWYKSSVSFSHKLSNLQNFKIYHLSYRRNNHHEKCAGMGPNCILFKKIKNIGSCLGFAC